jgi:hypothetical protein
MPLEMRTSQRFPPRCAALLRYWRIEDHPLVIESGSVPATVRIRSHSLRQELLPRDFHSPVAIAAPVGPFPNCLRCISDRAKAQAWPRCARHP